ncbi:MAG: hypothetical protein ABW172_09620 [Candidatus Binatia bacterium]
MKSPAPDLPKPFLSWTCSLLVVLLLLQFQQVHAQTNVQESYDREYGYMFSYPASWKLRRLPEGDANQDIRLVLQGPNGGTFTVVIDKTKKITKRTEFENDADRTRRVGEMMQQTIGQIYQSISESIKAVNMKVGEQSDLSNDFGIKFYLATLHTMKQGKPIIVAGIHCFPFDKDYSVNFTMTTFWDPAATEENDTLAQVLNSFRLVGEPQADGNATRPGGGKQSP